MAVYQGARQRTIALPRAPRVPRVGIANPALPRRRARAAVRARRGPSRISILLAAIVVAFAGAFFSLSQDVRVSATGYELDRLVTAQRHLDAEVEDLRNELNRLGKAPAIRKQAIDAGLGPLAEPLVIPAR
jgi:cell division protein FtsB